MGGEGGFGLTPRQLESERREGVSPSCTEGGSPRKVLLKSKEFRSRGESRNKGKAEE